MTNQAGMLKNYREFCEAITDQAERPWFLTLANVYLKLYQHRQENVQAVLESLDDLIRGLHKLLKFRR